MDIYTKNQDYQTTIAGLLILAVAVVVIVCLILFFSMRGRANIENGLNASADSELCIDEALIFFQNPTSPNAPPKSFEISGYSIDGDIFISCRTRIYPLSSR